MTKNTKNDYFFNMIINLLTLIKQNIHKHRFSIKHCYSTLKLRGESHKKLIILVPLGVLVLKMAQKWPNIRQNQRKKYLYAYFDLFEIHNGHKTHLEPIIYNSTSILIAKLGGIHTWGYPRGVKRQNFDKNVPKCQYYVNKLLI